MVKSGNPKRRLKIEASPQLTPTVPHKIIAQNLNTN
jgi:hypothetical protein